MLAAERRVQLEQAIERGGACRVADLAVLLDVSEMTVRRDLDALAKAGRLTKVHGGALSLAAEPLFADKSRQAQAEKQRIAKRAARRVQPGSALGIGAGSTTAAFAVQVAQVPGITVVTNSIAVSEAFHRAGAQGQTVVLTGGQRTPSDALVGPASLATLRDLHLDAVYLGTHGLDLEHGLTTPNLLEADTNRALVAAASEVVVLADSSKWGVVGLATFATLPEVDVLVTDAVAPTTRRAVRKHLELVVA